MMWMQFLDWRRYRSIKNYLTFAEKFSQFIGSWRTSHLRFFLLRWWVDGRVINSPMTISSILFAKSLRVTRARVIRYTFMLQLLRIHGNKAILLITSGHHGMHSTMRSSVQLGSCLVPSCRNDWRFIQLYSNELSWWEAGLWKYAVERLTVPRCGSCLETKIKGRPFIWIAIEWISLHLW